MGEGGVDGLPFLRKHPHQRSFPAVNQFSVSEQKGINNCVPCYPCPFFGEAGKD